MKTKYTYLYIIAVLFITSSCSNNLETSIYTTELKFPEFNSIYVKNARAVEIIYGEEQTVIVEGNQEQIKNIISDVIANSLTIDVDNENSEIKYYITIPEIQNLQNESNGQINLYDFNQELSLNITNLGQGNITFGAFNNVKLLNIDIEGTGNVSSISNMDSLQDLSIKLENSGNFDAYSVEAKNVIIESNSSGTCYVSAKETLNVFINSKGSVYYKGNPDIISSIKGTGNLIKVKN